MTRLTLKEEGRKLKKIIKFGGSAAITIPATWARELGSNYVWVWLRDHEIIIQPVFFDRLRGEEDGGRERSRES